MSSALRLNSGAEPFKMALTRGDGYALFRARHLVTMKITWTRKGRYGLPIPRKLTRKRKRGSNGFSHVLCHHHYHQCLFNYLFISGELQSVTVIRSSSTTEVMSYPAFAPFSVCLSVCLLASSRKTADLIFMKILPEMNLWTKKELIKFWRSSGFGSRNILKNFSITS